MDAAYRPQFTSSRLRNFVLKYFMCKILDINFLWFWATTRISKQGYQFRMYKSKETYEPACYIRGFHNGTIWRPSSVRLLSRSNSSDPPDTSPPGCIFCTALASCPVFACHWAIHCGYSPGRNGKQERSLGEWSPFLCLKFQKSAIGTHYINTPQVLCSSL